MIVCLFGGGSSTIPILIKAKLWVTTHNSYNNNNNNNVYLTAHMFQLRGNHTLLLLYCTYKEKEQNFVFKRKNLQKGKSVRLQGQQSWASDSQSIFLFSKKVTSWQGTLSHCLQGLLFSSVQSRETGYPSGSSLEQ